MKAQNVLKLRKTNFIKTKLRKNHIYASHAFRQEQNCLIGAKIAEQPYPTFAGKIKMAKNKKSNSKLKLHNYHNQAIRSQKALKVLSLALLLMKYYQTVENAKYAGTDLLILLTYFADIFVFVNKMQKNSKLSSVQKICRFRPLALQESDYFDEVTQKF